ncbi:MAG: 50S ribosomal protein L3 [Deltaproteobacteria bacterium]|nr:50S ribosomal protein L3 [Deltaproteobacteria bacterium]
MRMGIIGKKLGMTQIFTEAGLRIPVTVIKVDPNLVLDVKTVEKHGYNALQLAFDEQKASRLNSPDRGQFEKRGHSPRRFIRELRLRDEDKIEFTAGQEITASEVFKAGDPVDVTGTSKGKGFQGVMKRYNFAGFEQTHGNHEYFRHGGSIGCRLTPGRVVKGKKMAGHMGSRRVTVQNLKIVKIIPEDNIVLLSGGVPGAMNSLVVLRYAVKKRVYL